MNCVLLCKVPTALKYQCIRCAPDREVTFSAASLFGKYGLKVRLEPVLGTLHFCILRTVLCGDTVGDNKPTCNAEWLSMSGEQLYLLTQSSTSSCCCSTSAFSEHNGAFEELSKFPCCFFRDRQVFPGWLFKRVFHCNCLLNLDY